MECDKTGSSVKSSHLVWTTVESSCTFVHQMIKWVFRVFRANQWGMGRALLGRLGPDFWIALSPGAIALHRQLQWKDPNSILSRARILLERVSGWWKLFEYLMSGEVGFQESWVWLKQVFLKKSHVMFEIFRVMDFFHFLSIDAFCHPRIQSSVSYLGRWRPRHKKLISRAGFSLLASRAVHVPTSSYM